MEGVNRRYWIFTAVVCGTYEHVLYLGTATATATAAMRPALTAAAVTGMR